MSQSTQRKLYELIEPLVEDAGFELVELEYQREQGWVLRLYIERPNLPVIKEVGVAPGQGVTLDECSDISRQVSALLDVEDVIPHQYTLQVSSPGVQRPLRKEQDFQRFCGCRVRVKTYEPIPAEEQEGKKTPKPSRNMLGDLAEVTETAFVVDVQGNHFHVPFDKVARAHLDPDMDLWMQAAKKVRSDKGE